MFYSIPRTFRRPTYPVHLISFEILDIYHVLLLSPLHLAPHKVDDNLGDLYLVLHLHECYYFLSVISIVRDLPVISKAINIETAEFINVNESMI
jgi:hypothetical protein